MSLSGSTTIQRTYYVHQNVGDTLLDLYNYHKYPKRVHDIIHTELSRSGMDWQSVMVIDHLPNKYIHTIRHTQKSTYQIVQRLPRRIIVHMVTGYYLDVVVENNEYRYKHLDRKLQPLSITGNKPPKVYTFNVPRPRLSNR